MPRREAFYWAAVLATFALGTAAGDLTANTLGLGYFGSIRLFAAIALAVVHLARTGKGTPADQADGLPGALRPRVAPASP